LTASGGETRRWRRACESYLYHPRENGPRYLPRSMSPRGSSSANARRPPSNRVLEVLKEIDAQVPEGLDVHIVMDNYATHKTPKIKAWLARRPHYHVHFTPTSASWINQVERWFAEFTRKQMLLRFADVMSPLRSEK
jgi:hypothetical protein